MNIVGTPYSEVHRSWSTASSAARGRSRAGTTTRAVRRGRQVAHHHPEAVVEGYRHAHPVVFRVAGTLAVKWPLLRMFRCDSVAPFGNPVVPEVYWMLIASSVDSRALARRGVGRPRRASASNDSHSPSERTRPARARPSRPHLGHHPRVVARLETRARRTASSCRTGLVRTAARRRYAGLMVTRIAPTRAVANWMIVHSSRFGAQIPTRSPFSRPAAIRPGPARRRPLPARRTCSADPGSQLDQRIRSPNPATVRLRLSPIVSPSSGVSLVADV